MKDIYKILVVNRDKDFLGKIEREKEKEKEAGMYAFEIAQTADSALEKIKGEKYHIVLIDFDIPDKNGVELLYEIKSYDPMAQIIITAKSSTMEIIFCALEGGANDFIADPLNNFEELKRMIDFSAEKLERWRKSILALVE